MSAVLLLASAGAYLAYRHYTGRIGSVQGLGDLSPETRKGQAANYLVVGSDTVDQLDEGQLDEIGVNRAGRAGVRTDTVILVHVPADGSGARFVSFPRDSLVTIPGHGRNKLNKAFTLGEGAAKDGGPAAVIATVERLSGMHIDHYVQISLYGFYAVTNAIGGVEVCLNRPAQDGDANIDLAAGRQVLHGKDALAFVRQRDGVPGGDIGRIRRQQHFMASLVRQVLSARSLLNPFRLNKILVAAGDSVTVDPGTTGKDLVDLGLRMKDVAAGRVEFQTVPVLNPAARADLPGQRRASVVLLDEARLPGFFLDVTRGTTAGSRPTPAPHSSVSATPRPGSPLSPTPNPRSSSAATTSAADTGCVA